MHAALPFEHRPGIRQPSNAWLGALLRSYHLPHAPKPATSRAVAQPLHRADVLQQASPAGGRRACQTLGPSEVRVGTCRRSLGEDCGPWLGLSSLAASLARMAVLCGIVELNARRAAIRASARDPATRQTRDLNRSFAASIYRMRPNPPPFAPWPNPYIERTSSSRLRLLPAAAHVKR